MASTGCCHMLGVGAVLLSLSRVNHQLPGREAHSDVVQGAAAFHHEIADTVLPQADAVFDNATTLDAAVDMVDLQPRLGERLVRPLLLQRQLLAAGCLGRYKDRHLRAREREAVESL